MAKDQDKSLKGEGEKMQPDLKVLNHQDCESEDKEPLDEGSEYDEASEIKELNEKYMRTLADMENLRKRHDREMVDLRKFAVEATLKDMLPVLDSFDRALSQDEIPEGEFSKGMRLVFDQMQNSLAKHGLEAFNSVGEEFDPNRHQAIQTVEKPDVDVEVVENEFVKGYTLNGRLLRAAMVAVAKPQNDN